MDKLKIFIADYQFSKWKIGMLIIVIGFLILSSPITSYSSEKPLTESQDFALPELQGPEYLCTVFGGIIGTFNAGGDPETDVYTWTVIDPNGVEILKISGGGDKYETANIPFGDIGKYQVKLNVRRNNVSNFYEDTLIVTVQKGPELAIKPDYLLCNGGSAVLTAINTAATENAEAYTIVWKDVVGNELGRGNTYETNKEGYYQVEIFLTDSNGGENCLINGSTYVGPPDDFQIIQNTEKICDGQSIEFSINKPIAGEWFIRKDSEQERVSLGKGYQIEIEPDEIDGTGYFEVFFSSNNPEFPDCNSVRSEYFFVQDSPNITVTETSKPDDCESSNGVFQITTQTALDSLVIPELNFKQVGIPSGETIPFSNLESQVYTVRAYGNGCGITKLMKLQDASSPPDALDIAFETVPEQCSATGIIQGKLTMNFPSAKTGTYRIFDKDNKVVSNGSFTNQNSKTIDLDGGTYQLEFKIGDCTYPYEEFTIGREDDVNFSVPGSLNVCETIDFIPQSDQDLLYTLTFPDGHQEQASSNETFTLTESGDYEVTGIANDNSGKCPTTKTFKVTVSQSISFDIDILQEDCFGVKVYQAIIEGIDPKDAIIRWQNEDGAIVGRGTIFFPASYGKFSLLVQPRQTSACPVEKVFFDVFPPVQNIEMELVATNICPEPNEGIITLTTNADQEIDHLEWILYDENEIREDLTEFDDAFEITTQEPGVYEVVAFNSIGCELGRKSVIVEESLSTPPVLEETYAVCSNLDNSISTINPGTYAEYYWYFEDQLISTEPTLKPEDIGNYSLEVKTEDGCEFFAEFSTYEVCDYQVVFPNAMILNNPQKDFRVLLTESVSEAELFIINKQGTLIRHDVTTEIPAETPVLQWDGTVNGKNIIPGTYVVILYLRSEEFGFEIKLTDSLLVLE